MPLPVPLDQVLQDARAGSRILKTSPGVSATAILLIALVIGGNITIYSMVRTLLTRPAPGVEAEGLVTIAMTVDGRVAEPYLSHPDYLDFAAQSSTVQPLLSADSTLFTLTLSSGSYSVRGSGVSSNYFDTIGVRPIRGRVFTDAESRLDASGLVAIIGDRVWEEYFQRAEDVLGRAITLNGHAATIIGVAPPRFQGLLLGDQVEVWVPADAFARLRGTEAQLADRRRPAGFVIGRLAPGRSLSEAQAEFAAISARLQNASPERAANTVFQPVPYSMTAGGNSVFATQAPRFLAIFSVVTVLTLGIVCANIANLLLARIVARQRELAVRLSLGASRLRLLRLLVAEGLTLSLLAAAAAFGLAWWVSRAIVGFLTPAGANPLFNFVDFTPDWRVAGYAAVLAVAGAIAFTLAPASRAWKQDLLSYLKAGEQGIVQGRSRLSGVLAVVQLAFAVLLLTCAGLAYRSLSLIETSELGFDASGLLILTANTTGSASGPEDNAALVERLTERLLTVTGVQAVSTVATVPPFGGIMEPIRTGAAGPPTIAERNFVGPGYFELLGTPALAGRTFSRDDVTRGNPLGVVNQNLADTLWPGQSPLGRTVLYGERRDPIEIVGVVPNSQYVGFRPDPRPNFVFLLDRQRPRPPGQIRFYVRYSGGLEQVAPAIRTSLRDLDARVPIIAMATMEVALSTATSPVRTITTMLALFASVSLLVAAIGLYGVIAFNIRKRTRDFGVRLALGASSQQVLRSVLGEGLLLTASGVVAGFVLSVLAGLALRRLLLGVTPTDPPTYLAVFALLAVVSLAASYVPARRASRVNPVQALRQE